MTKPKNKKPSGHVKYKARRNIKKRGSGSKRGGKPLRRKKLSQENKSL